MYIIFLLSSYSHSSPSTFFRQFSINLPVECEFKFVYIKPRSWRISHLFNHVLELSRTFFLANSRSCIIFSLGFSSDLFRSIFLPNSVSSSFCRGELTSNYQSSLGFLGFLAGFLHLKLISLSTLPVTMHTDMQVYFYKLTQCPSFLLYNYNDPSFLLQPSNLVSSSAPNIINFSVVGSLSSCKNVEEALFIFSGFTKHTNRQIHLHVFGSGPREPRLRKLVSSLDLSDIVIFHGHCSPSFIHSLTDILLHSSISEGTSRAVMESLQSSSLVVHRNISGVHSLIENGKNGFIYDSPSHAVSLLPSILSLYDSHSSFKLNPSTKSLLPEYYSQSFFKSSVATLLSLLRTHLF